jgi:membrane associated rhomboid family serine protease
MFIPIGDDNRDRRTTPFVNYILIALNIFAFIWWQDWGQNIDVTFGYAAVPAEILTGKDIITNAKIMVDPITGQRFEMPGLQLTPLPVFLTLFTSMFMHGGLAHLGGNMLYLWIFGDNIEDRLGHLNYLFFYLLCGMLAGLSHVFSTVIIGQSILIPSLGASGAISAVLGGYLRLFPGRSVHIWIFFFIISVPAFISVGLWFVFQVVNGLGALGGEEAGGVAYAAHIGGFIAGLILIKMFAGKAVVANRRTSPRYYKRFN